MLKELDYEQEASNLRTFARNLDRYDDIVIPAPIDDFCSLRVLTMSHLQGSPISELGGLSRLDFDASQIAATLCKAYLDQILVHGFVHADPHPGNVWLTRDHRLGLLDLGMVAFIDPDMRTRLLRLLLALSEYRGEAVAETCLAISTPLDGSDRERAIREAVAVVAEYQHAAPQARAVGRTMLELVQVAVRCGIRPAEEITLVGKTLLYLDQIADHLAPEFDPDSVVRTHCGKILSRHLSGSLNPNRVMSSMLDAQILADELPKQAHKIVNALANNRFKIEVDAIDQSLLMRNIEKIANRIAAGLVLAALIVGAALLMPIESSWTLFGYPGLAIILFGIAVVGGLVLVVDALILNREKRP